MTETWLNPSAEQMRALRDLEIEGPVPNSIFEETVSVLFSGEVSDPHLPARGPDGHLEFQHRRAGGAYRGPFCTQTRRESSRAPVRKSLG